MENNPINTEIPPGTASVIQPNTPPPPPPTPIVEPVTPPISEKGSSIFGNKLELLEIGLLALVASSYIMSIYHYRKQIEASNSMKNIQNQIDQIKLKLAS